jgi:hypothetical protein
MIRSAARGHLIASAGSFPAHAAGCRRLVFAGHFVESSVSSRAPDSPARSLPAHRAPYDSGRSALRRPTGAGWASPHVGLSPPRRRPRSGSAPACLQCGDSWKCRPVRVRRFGLKTVLACTTRATSPWSASWCSQTFERGRRARPRAAPRRSRRRPRSVGRKTIARTARAGGRSGAAAARARGCPRTGRRPSRADRVEHIPQIPGRDSCVAAHPGARGALAALRQDDGTASRQRRSSLSRPASWSSCTRFTRR